MGKGDANRRIVRMAVESSRQPARRGWAEEATRSVDRSIAQWPGCSGISNLLYNPGALTTSERPDEPSGPYSAPSSFQAFSELLRLLAAKSSQGSPSNAGDHDPAEPGVLAYAPLMQLIAQVMLAWAASGLRSWARAAEILGTTLPITLEALADSGDRTDVDPAEKARRLDALRAAFRELADLPGRESQRLQAELDRLLFGAGPDTDRRTGSETDAPWRRWEAKP